MFEFNKYIYFVIGNEKIHYVKTHLNTWCQLSKKNMSFGIHPFNIAEIKHDPLSYFE